MDMLSSVDMRSRPELGPGGIGLTAAGLFGLLSWKVLKHRTWQQDFRLWWALPRYGEKTRTSAMWFGHLGKEWAVLPVAAALAGKLWNDDRTAAAVTVAVAASGAVAASHIFDVALPKRSPPPGRRAPLTPSYPSGHALHSTAFLLTSAYVLSREKLVDSRRIGGLALVLSAALGVDRLIHDRHWTTDVIAGWLAAVAIAGSATAGYEIASRRSGSRGHKELTTYAPRVRKRPGNT